ncbi:hypothetical protein [Jannaschia formosa]|uniref:hypothetical protein n=1 Tax=Jannaschia formosa TaxID=2259592 RepID=UPI000E1C0757|nr:hypothetical protein [Jannaschia formosa]TFL19921.1 hypothetical protein DR046_00815 [Jannaschia formosa]
MAELKLATCCYCGTRTTLRPTARDGHALACAFCGAALTAMKPLRPVQAEAAARHPRPAHPVRLTPRKAGKRKKRKGFLQKLVEEIRDGIEDIFD